MTDCVFCEIVAQNAPAEDFLFHRDGQAASFVPLNPVVEGHRLFVPYGHIPNAATQPEVTGFVFSVAARWGMMFGLHHGADFNLIVNNGPDAGQTVDHLHVHYVPRRPGDGLLMPWGGVK